MVPEPVSDLELKSWQAAVPTRVHRHISAAFPPSAEGQAIISKYTNLWYLTFSNRQRWVVCTHHGGETALGLGNKAQTQQDPICLEQRLLHPEKKPVQGKVWGVREGDLVAVEGMSLGEPQGLLALKPHENLTFCTLAVGGKAEGVRTSTCCRFRIASSKRQIQAVFKVATTGLMFPIL